MIGSSDENIKRQFIDWVEYGQLCEKLFKDIMTLQLDGIVGIGRGGVMLGSYLAHKMRIPLYTAFVRHVGTGDNMKIEIDDLGKVVSFPGGNFLLVDDWLVSGKAMGVVLDNVSDPVYVRTAVMVCNPDSELKPDYVSLYSRNKIHFPYD